jgi:hypothetical protein
MTQRYLWFGSSAAGIPATSSSQLAAARDSVSLFIPMGRKWR